MANPNTIERKQKSVDVYDLDPVIPSFAFSISRSKADYSPLIRSCQSEKTCHGGIRPVVEPDCHEPVCCRWLQVRVE